MKKITWKTAFSLSVIIHLLLSVAICSSNWNQQEQMQVKEVKNEPIEVELGTYSEPMLTKDAPQQESMPSVSESVPNFNKKNKTVNQSNNAVTQDSMPAGVSSAADSAVGTANSQGTIGGPSGGSSSVGSPAGSGSSAGGSSSGTPAGNGTGRTAKVAVIYGPTPDYPNEARSEGWEGTVRVRVLISEEGSVRDAVVVGSSGHSCMDAAALEGIQSWRFSPAYKNGEAVSAWVVVPVVFDLR